MNGYELGQAIRRVPSGVWKGIVKLAIVSVSIDTGFYLINHPEATGTASELTRDLFIVACFLNALMYLPSGLRDLASASFRLNAVVGKIDEFRSYLFPPIQRLNAGAGALLLFMILIWAAEFWHDWLLLFQYRGAPAVTICLALAAAAIAGMWWCLLLVGRAYGEGVRTGFRMSAWYFIMWISFAGFALVSAMIVYAALIHRAWPMPLSVPGFAAGCAVMWWFSRRRFLRNVQWLTGEGW